MVVARNTLLIASACAVVACGQKAAAPVVTPVKVATVEQLADANGLRYSAQVVPETQLNLNFRTDGYIVNIIQRDGAGGPRILQAGDTVSKGEVLAQVDAQQYQDQVTEARAQLESARAQLRKADQDFGRAKALMETKSITAPDFDAAELEYSSSQAGVEAAQAQLDAANEKLGNTQLIAPLDATVLQRDIEIGSLVHSGSVGFVLANTNAVKVVFGVPDVMLKNISPGSVLNVRTESLPGEVLSGEVTEIAPAADQRTRVFEVSVTLDNSDGRLRPGMVASLDVDKTMLPEQPVTVVPLSAVVREGEDGFAVFVVDKQGDDTTVRLQAVETGHVLGNRISVTTGLQVGEQVVVSGTAQIKDQQVVKVVP